MASKRVSLFLVMLLLLASWAAMGVASATNAPTTTLSLQSSYHGSLNDGDSTYVAQNPIFVLSPSAIANSTVLNTEYEITQNGQLTTANYSSPVTIPTTHSTNISLRYRSNSTTGLESWKSLDMLVDADAPSISLSSGLPNPLKYILNSSIYVTSPGFPLRISCSDNGGSGVSNLSGAIGSDSIFGLNGILSLSSANLPSGINGTSPFSLEISCRDNVENYYNQTYNVILDDSVPVLTVQESGIRVGSCISGSWGLTVQSTDSHSNSIVQKWNGAAWSTVSGMMGVPSGFNDTITLRSIDSAGFQSLNQSWAVAVDSTPPSISASLNQSTLSLSSSDSCGLSSFEYRWETLTGQLFGWITAQQGAQFIPTSLNGSIVRAQIRAMDVVGNSAQYTTGWVNTNGSTPYSVVSVQTNRVGTLITANTSLLVTPVGNQASTSWELFVNNVSESTGTLSTQGTVTDIFSHGDQIQLVTNTSDSLGSFSIHSWNWTVDHSNSQSLQVSITGQYLNTSGLILGPDARLVPGAASDDSFGVGGSHASCSWDGSSWFQVTSNAVYAPSTTSGTVQSYIFACRSVDLLDNLGPITWKNGSVDSQSPTVTLQPNSGETIGLGSQISVNMSDSNGITSGLVQLTWSNGSSTSYSNISIGVTNWSSSLGQIFNGLTDGTVTANVIVFDAVGNQQSILGRSWILNTSSPYLSMVLTGVYSGLFISNDSTGISMNLPSGGWTGLWNSYTLTDSSGAVVSGNVTVSTTLQPASLPEGLVWLNTTIGDSLGRTQSQGWIFTVDHSNSQSPLIQVIGMNVTINTVIWIGVGSQLRVSNINDDPSGVGANIASCSWDEITWSSVVSGSSISPSITSGSIQNHTLSCMNVDVLGNTGPIVQINVSSETILPSQSLSPPSGDYIAPNSILSVITSDQSGIQSSRLNLTWSDGQNTWQHDAMIYSSNWSSSINSLYSGLTDGVITVSLYTIDNLGNENLVSNHIWNLNTSQPQSNVSLSGSFYGSFVAGNNFNIHLTPPSAGNLNGWSIYTLEHSNGTTITSGNASTITQINQTLMLDNGMIWLNVTSHDRLLRSQSQSWSYFVDNNVGTAPLYSITGSAINQLSNPILGSSGRISITTLQDDLSGVGSSHGRCTWDGTTWFTTNKDVQLVPQSNSGSIMSYTLGCSVVDLLGNIGIVAWSNGTTDLRNPTVSYSISSGNMLSYNSTFTVSCSDSSGCELIQISAFFYNGSSSWSTVSLSSSNSTVSLSSLLNTTSSGTITFYVVSNDLLGNSINQSSSTFQYLHDLATITVSLTSPHSGSYVNGNLSFIITPSSGWMSGINITLSVEHSSNTLFSGVLNQSLSNQSFNDLSEGQVWINSTICDFLSRCSNSSIQLLVDTTGPSNPAFSIPNAQILSNQSYIVQGSQQITFWSGNDSASGTFQTICTGSNGAMTFTNTQTVISVQSLAQSNTWSTIICYSKDKVGNIGGSMEVVLLRDDIPPSLSIIDSSASGVITPLGWYNASCTDDILFSNLYLEIRSSGTVLYQLNSSGPISLRYGTLSVLGSSGQFQFHLTCSDAAGNIQQDARTHEWLTELSSSIISVSGIQYNGTQYVTHLGVVSLSNSRQDVYHEYRYILNGSTGSWVTENSSSFSLDLGPGNDSKILQLQVRVLKSGTSLSNTSFSSIMVIDLIGPLVEMNTNTILSNGSVIDLTASTVGVGITDYVWSWDNGTSLQSSILSDVLLPASTSTSSWLTIYAIDSFGHLGDSLEVSIIRDITPPEILVNHSNIGYLGPNAIITVGITESTGLLWSTIHITGTAGQSNLIVSNVSSYQLTSTDYPAWIWTKNTVELVIQTSSNSGIFAKHTLSLTVDDMAPTTSISAQLSINTYGLNTSNNSLLSLTRSVDTSQFCVKVGDNPSGALESNCISELNNTFQYSRLPGTYVLIANATDFAGNNRISIFNLTHHSSSPTISSSIASILRPGSTQNYTGSSTLPFTMNIRWDGNQIQDRGGWFTIPSGSGSHTLSLNITDVLGFSSEYSWNVTLDGEHPSISFEGNFYANSDFGSNTTLFINSTEIITLISNITITVSSGSNSCLKYWNPIHNQFILNGTLKSILSSVTCPILESSNLPITVNISTTDSVGNYGQSIYLMNYHGKILVPYWTLINSVQNTTSVWSSNYSIHTCHQGTGTVLLALNLSWSGNSGVIDGNNLSEVLGSGVINCLVQDLFGNNASSHLNVSFDSTLPSTSISWPSTSNGTLVRAGGNSFTLLGADSETGITSLDYCIATLIPCIPNLSTFGSIPAPASNGNYTLFMRVINGVGLTVYSNLTFTSDNDYPVSNVINAINTTIQNSIIYVGSANPMISVIMVDNYCITGGVMEWDNGNISIANGSLQAIPSSATWLRIDAVDCVGHISTNNFSIQRISQISPLSIVVHSDDSSDVISQSSGYIHDGNFSLILTSSHPVEVNLSCGLSLVYTCKNTNIWNSFEISITSFLVSEQIQFSFTDQLGNSLTQAINISADTTVGVCEVEEGATLGSTTITLPSSRSSRFSCTDDLAGVRSVQWQGSTGAIAWSILQNNSWSAPPPMTSQSFLVITDHVGNVYSKSYIFEFDDQAPTLSIQPFQNSISFDEEVSRSDASFFLSCSDMFSQTCLIDVTITDSNTGVNLSEIIYIVNAGNVSIPLAPLNSTIRIEINVADELGNHYFLSKQFEIDDDSPIIEIEVFSQFTGDLLPLGIISHDGIISLRNLENLDVNYSLSTGYVLTCDSGLVNYSGVLASEYTMSDFDLTSCGQVTFEIKASDHVGNTFSTTLFYSVDYLQPTVSYSIDPTCSWNIGNHVDARSNCEVEVFLNDDRSSNLSSSFEITLVIDGSVVRTYNLRINQKIILSDYPDSSISISVNGSDKVGNQIVTNSLNVVTIDDITPVWNGLICTGNTVCNWSGQIVAASLNESIKVTTPYLQAPIIEFEMIFENALEKYTFNENNFSASSLPDGSYLLTLAFKDAAGREYRPQSVSFIYDNTPPEIEILESLSNGIIDNSTILSCDICELVWRVNEISNYTSSTNHGILSFDENQFRISTTTLGQNTIIISAVDAFGRTSERTYYTIPVQTTIINPIEELISANNLNIQCMETASIDNVRQVTCLWTRKGTTVDTLPIRIEVEIDQKELRVLQLSISKPGGAVEVLELDEGSLILPNINHYADSFEIHLLDQYSVVNPIQFHLIEHTSAWSEMNFVNPELSEESIISNLELWVTPPSDEEEFHLIKRGFVDLDDLFSCESVYMFSQLDGAPIRIDSKNCQIDTDSLTLMENESLYFMVQINHANVHDSAMNGDSEHPLSLFNLESYSLIISYSDELGVTSTTNRELLKLKNITRAEDNSPSFNGDFSNSCPLGLTTQSWTLSDGFLQSQVTAPLSECGNSILDEDGIHRVVWAFIFSEGNQEYELEIDCSYPYFPRDWNFDAAIDANWCEVPSNPFPSGVYDVSIRPLIVDESVYFRDRADYTLTEGGLYGKPIYGIGCENDALDCQFIEYTLYDVVVSPSLNPVEEVENSKKLVESAKIFVKSKTFDVLFILTILTLFGIISSVYLKVFNSRRFIQEPDPELNPAKENLTIEQVNENYELTDRLKDIIFDYEIEDQEQFLLFAANSYDLNQDGRLSYEEMVPAAEEWSKLQLAKLTVSQLRFELKSQNLPVSGKKDELITRLMESKKFKKS